MAFDRHLATEIRVPEGQGQLLLVPSLEQGLSVLNRAAPSRAAFGDSSAGQATVGSDAKTLPSDWEALREDARRSMLSLARQYTGSYRSVAFADHGSAQTPVVLSGHQPELFHCGVWFKNFLVSRLAQQATAIPVHFIVDNDLCRSASIRVPNWNQPGGFQSVPIDRETVAMPWEHRYVLDRSLWNTVPDRVLQACSPLRDTPMIEHFWQYVRESSPQTTLAIACSQARHRLEEELGWNTLEVPLSHLCRTVEFAKFSLKILLNIRAMHGAYNQALDGYRATHRIQNHAQPLPNLSANESWIESPWWCYSQGSERRPLWVRVVSNKLELSDLKDWHRILGDADVESCLDAWMSIEGHGINLRPRALITTLYTRMMISDLFVHGIGGGRYDQITDQLIQGLWGVQPPPFLVASATLRLNYTDLPKQFDDQTAARLATAKQIAQSCAANPELLLKQSEVDLAPETMQVLRELAMAKQQLLASMPEKGEKWEWHQSMKKVKAQLAQAAQPSLQSLSLHIQQLHENAARKAQLDSREYSFCLFSLQQVAECFQQIQR